MNRRRREEELERDIADHIAMETEDNIARGMSPPEARFAALRKFGNVARVKEDTRSVWGWTALDTWRADVRQALRRMRRSPGTVALAVPSLALAFAPSVTVFSVMDRLLLTPLPIKAPREIVEIQFRDTRPNAEYHFQPASYPEFQAFRRSACGSGKRHAGPPTRSRRQSRRTGDSPRWRRQPVSGYGVEWSLRSATAARRRPHARAHRRGCHVRGRSGR
jgi:hypothetical protein